MKVKIVTALFLLTGWVSSHAQVEEKKNNFLPKPPTAFETRNTNRYLESGPTVKEVVKRKSKKVTVIAVTKSRAWKDSKGKIVNARLIGYEVGKGKQPDLIRDGKIRLLVDGAKRLSVLPLAKLSAKDQAYIKGLDAARKKDAQKSKAQ